jgi:hypothetical protein
MIEDEMKDDKSVSNQSLSSDDDEVDEILEQVEKMSIQKAPKVDKRNRERTDAQKKAFENARIKRAQNIAAEKKEKEDEMTLLAKKKETKLALANKKKSKQKLTPVKEQNSSEEVPKAKAK